MRCASLSLLTILWLMLAVAPAMAYTLYSNGPINGTTDAWQINSGFSVSDSFTPFTDVPVLEGLDVGVWLVWGDTMTSVQVDIGTSSFGTDQFSGVLTATGSTDLGFNQFGYDIRIVNFTFADIRLPGGNYWLTLSNADVSFGDPVYWDENSGMGCDSTRCPSSAFENSLGSIPSEAFTVTGDICGSCATSPEPSTILLFGSGMLGLAGVLRRKLCR